MNFKTEAGFEKEYVDDKYLWFMGSLVYVNSLAGAIMLDGITQKFCYGVSALMFCIHMIWSISLVLGWKYFITDDYESNYSLITTVPAAGRLFMCFAFTYLWVMMGNIPIAILTAASLFLNTTVYQLKIRHHKEHGWLELS